MPPVAIGETVRAGGVGIIIASHSAAFKKGTYVTGLLGWQQFCKIHVSKVSRVPTTATPSLYLGALGMTGLTAYVAIKTLGKAAKKQVVVVSTAAGAVGSVAVQVAKALGCKVVGITGSAEKAEWLNEIGIEFVINYKTENVGASLKKICPEGVDLYLDHVGGSMLDAVLLNANKGSRMILCGAIQSYNQKKPQAMYMYPVIISKSIKVRGFIVTDYYGKMKEAHQFLSGLLSENKLKYKEDVIEGLENGPRALRKLLTGDNVGKTLIRVVHDEAKL